MIFGTRAKLANVLVACAVLGGTLAFESCSYIFVQPAKNDDGIVRAGDCTTNLAAPVIDTILVSTNVMSAIYVANQDNVTNKGTAIGAGVGVAALWLSSAIYGYYFTSECKSLRESDEQGPYRRPVRLRRTVLSGPPAPRPPAGPPAGEEPAAAPPADAAPAGPPAAPQQRDDDDPTIRQRGPKASTPE